MAYWAGAVLEHVGVSGTCGPAERGESCVVGDRLMVEAVVLLSPPWPSEASFTSRTGMPMTYWL